MLMSLDEFVRVKLDRVIEREVKLKSVSTQLYSQEMTEVVWPCHLDTATSGVAMS